MPVRIKPSFAQGRTQTSPKAQPVGPTDSNGYSGQRALQRVRGDCQHPAVTARAPEEAALGRVALKGHRHWGQPASVLGAGDQGTAGLRRTLLLGGQSAEGRTTVSRSGDPGVGFQLQPVSTLSFPICKMENPPNFCFLFQRL